jgi:chorismate synthase
MFITIKGLPSNLPVSEETLNAELARRQRGYGRGGRQKIESDRAEILAGVYRGRTIGAPVTLAIWNKDWENWKNAQPPAVVQPRPGHADLSGAYKYDMRDDVRKVLERSSARETSARVAGGAICKSLLSEFGVEIMHTVVNWGGIEIPLPEGMSYREMGEISESNDLRCVADGPTSDKIREMVDQAAADGNTVGGTVMVAVSPMIPLLGSYVTWERKLDARIAQAVLSVQAMKGIEFGLGFGYADTHGRDAHDEIFYDREAGRFYRETNRAGGIEGGMSNGEAIVFRAAVKPIPTLMTPLRTVNLETFEPESASRERSDVTAVSAAGVILESVTAFVLADALLERYGGDSLEQIKHAVENDPALSSFRWKRS